MSSSTPRTKSVTAWVGWLISTEMREHDSAVNIITCVYNPEDAPIKIIN